MKLKKILAALIAAMMLLPTFTACTQNDASRYSDTVFSGMDSAITLRLANSGVEEKTLHTAAVRCQEIVAELEGILSFHLETSDLSALNTNTTIHLQPNETLLAVWNTACTMHTLTNGAYDPSLGTLTKIWNISNGGPVPTQEAISEALYHTGTSKLVLGDNFASKLDPALQIDLGGIGKGYALQEILTYLNSTEIDYGLVSIGENIGVFGQKPDAKPFQIGIKDPQNPAEEVGYLYIHSGFVAASGIYEHSYEKDGILYHHILDPKTGYPADTGLASVVCFAQNGATADALSTALFVMGTEEGFALYESGNLQFEAIFITAENQIYLTPGIAEKDLFQLTASQYTLAEQ